MRHSKWIAVIITIFNIALVIVCGIIWFRTDRISPEFKFRISELVYKEDTTEAELLEGITASDNRDGDVTDRIVIEKIIKSEKDSSVVVFYAVSDTAGNVVKTSRVFPASFVHEEAAEEQIALESNGTEADEIQAADPESADASVKEEEEEAAAEETEKDEASGGNEEKAEDKAENKVPEERVANTEAEESARDNNEQQAAEPADTEQAVTGAAPVMTLKVSEVTTKQGVTPAWVDVIGSLKDDTDSYEMLFSTLNVSKYDVNTAGDYKVSLTVTDSNKNTSKPVTLTIHVK